ncbi:MAG: addiction module protein [Chthoniobacteraceae bacterium]
MNAEEIIHEASRLPADQLAEIVDQLLDCVTIPRQPEIDAAWAVEADERVEAYEQGLIVAEDGPSVIAELRRNLKS